LVCLVLSAVFSSSETALLRLRRDQVDEDVAQAQGPTALAVRDLLSSTSRLLVTILLGNNVVNILGASVASAIAIHSLEPELGIPVATAIMTALVLVLCEVLPKAVAASHPRAVANLFGLPLYLLHQTLGPLTRSSIGCSSRRSGVPWEASQAARLVLPKRCFGSHARSTPNTRATARPLRSSARHRRRPR
jgi:Mg2+/Co2+ transporter CorB